jgi:type II secretory pathway pseudopilin PulG
VTAGGHRREQGTTVVELVVAMAIASVVAVVLFAAVVTVQRTEVYTEQDSRALAELRVNVDRFTRELREARRVYSGSSTTARSIKFWVDDDRDNQQDPTERVTWAVTAVGADGQLTRTTDVAGATPDRVSADIVVADAFTYTPAPPGTVRVDVVFQADVDEGRSAARRTVRTVIRLRNAGFAG